MPMRTTNKTTKKNSPLRGGLAYRINEWGTRYTANPHAHCNICEILAKWISPL